MKIQAKKTPYRLERTAEGRYFEHHFFPVIDKKGEVSLTAIFVEDITEYRRTENALKSSEDKYKKLVENISDVLYDVNEEGVIIYANPAVESFLGFTQEEVKGCSFEEFLYHDDVNLVMSDFEGFLAGTLKQTEYRFRRKDGSIRWGRVSSHAIVFQDTVIGYQGVISDITQTKTFNINLIRQAQESMARNLAGSVSMEIETPVAEARKTLAEYLAVRAAEIPGGAEPLRLLLASLERISLHLKNLEVFVEAEAASPRALDINPLIESSLALVKTRLQKEKVGVQCSLGRDLELVVGTPFSFVQVFINLFDHSLRTLLRDAPEQKSISIGTRMEKDNVVISFRDSSAGISEELFAHLSDPFYGHGEGKEIGTGLPIAMQLVENNRGSFQIVEHEGKAGFHIEISLPAVIQTI